MSAIGAAYDFQGKAIEESLLIELNHGMARLGKEG